MNGTKVTNGTTSASKLLWRHPSPHSTPMYKFLESVNEAHHLQLTDYAQLHKWSIENIDAFWKSTWDCVGVRHNGTPSSVSPCNLMRTLNLYLPMARRLIQALQCSHARRSLREQHSISLRTCSSLPNKSTLNRPLSSPRPRLRGRP